MCAIMLKRARAAAPLTPRADNCTPDSFAEPHPFLLSRIRSADHRTRDRKSKRAAVILVQRPHR
jgi:hypothetical protein